MPGIRGIEDDLGYTGLRVHVRQNGRKEHIMAKRVYWVQIETDTDNFGNPEFPDIRELEEILRKRGEVDIIDIVHESDIQVN